MVGDLVRDPPPGRGRAVTVTVTCWCGAELAIDDASEVASAEVLRAWHELHPHGRRPWRAWAALATPAPGGEVEP